MSTDTAAPEAADEGGALPPWVGGYLRDHAIHIAVVVFFLLYPFLYDVLVGQFGLPAEMLLPRLQTMLVVQERVNDEKRHHGDVDRVIPQVPADPRRERAAVRRVRPGSVGAHP